MRKTAIVVGLLSAFIGASKADACLFGDTLVQMARLRDLVTEPAQVLAPSSAVTPMQEKQILRGLRMEKWTNIETLKDAFDFTDDRRFISHRVFSRTNGRNYAMYIYSAGGNVHGFIFEEDTLVRVARVGDASLYDCTVQFTRYDSLPWFYSNFHR